MNATINHLHDQLALVQLALIEGRITEAAHDIEVIRLLDAIEKESSDAYGIAEERRKHP